MNHIDLFSGISGFAYAAQLVWGKDYHNICFCDNNNFCQQVIKKQFGKESLIYGDIRELTKERLIADANRNGLQKSRTEQQTGGNRQFSKITANAESQRALPTEQPGQRNGVKSHNQIDLLTGGFPCQPFSCAGKRSGTKDDRYLWPEMLRVIREFRPTWVIAENVRGILAIEGGLVFEQVCLDLEGEGYEVQPFIIPACAVNAPHRRDRVWIIAYRAESGLSKSRLAGIGKFQKEAKERIYDRFEQQNSHASNAKNERLQRRKQANSSKGAQPNDEQLYGRNREWDRNWFEVATELCGIHDGLSAELYFIGGLENAKLEDIKTKSEIDAIIRKILRYMWEQKEIAKTSQDLYKRGFYNLVPNLPPKSTYQKWNLGSWCEETTELRNLWKRFYSEGLTSTSDLQCKLLECIRSYERAKKVGGYTKAGHRTERLKALGNAIVPQIAIEIMKAIKMVDNSVDKKD